MKRTADRLFGDAYYWSVLGAGRAQMQIAAQAAVMGGNVRVGLEDSLWIGRGQLAKTNAEQVGKAKTDSGGARALGRDARTRRARCSSSKEDAMWLSRFLLLLCCLLPGFRAGLADQAGQVRLAVPAGRLGRPAGAPARGQARPSRSSRTSSSRTAPAPRASSAPTTWRRARPTATPSCFIFDTHSVHQALNPKLPFDPMKDFAPVMLVGYAPMAITTGDEQALQELRRRARRRQGEARHA